MENQNLIVIKQLPIIEEQLKQLSENIDKKVEKATSLICNEENKTSVKNLRAELNKEFMELESQRKEVKNKIMEPYMNFENIYKENVSDKYKQADKILKEKIDTIERQQKEEKENELKAYFYEMRASHNIDFINFENVGLNITLTASLTSLKKKIEDFVEKITSDIDLIETQQNKEEILIEYKKDLNISRAIREVVQRKEQLRQLEEKRINQNLENEKKQIESNLQQLANANTTQEQSIIEGEIRNTEKIYTITFTVTGTAPKLKQLKDYLIKEGYQYE